MPPQLDQAIVRALSLNASDASLSTHGGSGFASTYRITTPTTSIFVKTSTAKSSATMFEGEHTSLNAINNAVPSLSPKSFAWGKLDSGGYFLATEFLDMSGSRTYKSSPSSSGSGLTLAQKLAKLHTTPIPPEYQSRGFGFPVPTCCGETIQNNTWSPTWADFFAQNRLMHILQCAESNQGSDPTLRSLIEDVVARVVPRLLRATHLGGSGGITPVVCHGDLWSGNKGRAIFLGRNDGNASEDITFDPSACYGHNEYDHGIMNMFGGFSGGFWKEYFAICPKTEPESEYEDRVRLYEAYHHLNHYAMFGGGYKSGAVALLRGLVKKYG